MSRGLQVTIIFPVMGDIKPIIPAFDGEQHVLAAAQHIVKALGASNNLTDEFRRLLAEVDTHLSTMSILADTAGGQFTEVEERLKNAETKVVRRESNQSMIWDSGPREATEYLQAVDDIRRLTESLGSLSLSENGKQRELIHQAHVVLQMAMARLEDELIHILLHKKQSIGCEYMSFHSCGEDIVNDESSASAEDDLVEKTSGRNGEGNIYEYIIDLVHPDVIPDLKSIANVMFASNYDQEFCEAFISVRKDALYEYLVILKIEELSIEDVMKLESSSLNRIIKRWIRAMKILFRVYLASEKWLCKQILGKFGSVHSICFIETSKASILRLLNFGEAVAMGPHEPDQLFSLLNMYEVLADLLVDINTLFSVEAGSFIRTESLELLRKLGNSARATFREFKRAVASNTSTNPFPGGGIHHLTKYVMNYIRTLTDYGDTLNLLRQDQNGEIMGAVVEPENGQEIASYNPVATLFHSVTSSLETNLNCKSKLYKDNSLQHVFLMNNIHYMVQKVKKGSDLRTFLGDEWIKNHIVKFQQHARSYERETWSSVLSLLTDDVDSGLKSIIKVIIKQRFRKFTVAFEEIYKSQIGWSIPDHELREDLQISISQKVIHAYRTFSGRNSSCVGDKYIKYTADELESYLLDLFEGSPRSLNPFRRR